MDGNGKFIGGFYKPSSKRPNAVKDPIVKCCNDYNNCNDEDIDKTKVTEAVKVVDAVIRRDGGARRDGDVEPDVSTVPPKPPVVKSKNAAVRAAVGELTLLKVLVLSLTGLMMKLH